MRVVFDTNTVISALLFEHGRLSWLRAHWQSEDVAVLVSRATVDELIRALAHPKFQLERHEIEALLAEYLPHSEPVDVRPGRDTPKCSDTDDQKFIDLAVTGGADMLVTGDKALLGMALPFVVESGADYAERTKAER